MLYNGSAVKLPVCKESQSHYKNDESLCTLAAFLKRADFMSLSQEEYEKACFTKEKAEKDWD